MDRSLTMLEFGKDYAGVTSAKTAKRIVLREQIPHFTLNGRVLVKESDAQAWRESKMVEPEKPTLKDRLVEISRRVLAERRKAAS